MTAKTNPREVLDRAIRANLGGVHTTEICKVLEYEVEDGSATATVQPVTKRRTNLDTFVDPPILYGVPVPPLAWGDFIVHAPLNVGDFVLVSYAERSLDEWLANGTSAIEPSDSRRFSESDAVVLRKIDPLNQPPSSDSVQADALTLSKRDGSVRIVINADGSVVVDSDTIKLGSAGATKAVALAPDVEAELGRLWDALATHTHATAGTGTVTTPPNVVTTGTAAAPGPLGSAGAVGADKVDAE